MNPSKPFLVCCPSGRLPPPREIDGFFDDAITGLRQPVIAVLVQKRGCATSPPTSRPPSLSTSLGRQSLTLCFPLRLQRDTPLVFGSLEAQAVANLTGAVRAGPLHLELSSDALGLVLRVSPRFVRPPSHGLHATGLTLGSVASIPFPIDLDVDVITPSPFRP